MSKLWTLIAARDYME